MAEESIVLRRREFEQMIGMLLEEVQQVAEEEFLAALAKTNSELTGELKDSFKQSVLNLAQDMTGWVQFSFGKYGRFRDLRFVEYKGGFEQPNSKGAKYEIGNPYPEGNYPAIVQAMIKFVGRKGLANFKHIPGYKGSASVPITSRAVARLAFTFAINRMRKGRVRQKDTQFYSKSLGKILKELRPMVTEKMQGMILNGYYTRTWEG